MCRKRLVVSLVFGTLFWGAECRSALAQNARNEVELESQYVRIWRDRTGQFQIPAMLLGASKGVVSLQKEDGTTVDVSIDRLSDEDQRYIRETAGGDDEDRTSKSGSKTPQHRSPSDNSQTSDSTASFSEKADARQAWQFETEAGKRTIIHQGDGRWVTYFPNGTTAESEELNRTLEYVEIRNKNNKSIQRLYEEYGTVQKDPDGPFRRFGEGQWVEMGTASQESSPFGPTDYKIRVVYFVPQDRSPTNGYQQKIQVVLALIWEVMTKDLRSHGLKTEGPQFQARDGKAIVHLLMGERNCRDYNDLPHFNSGRHFKSIVEEVDRRLGSVQDHIVMIFAETYEEGPADKFWPGHAAKAVAHPPNGGAAVFSAWMLKDELCATDIEEQRRRFVDPTPVAGRRAIGSRNTNSSRSDFIEDGIGGMLHELAHTFGLPHDNRNPQIDIMGQGFRNLRWTVGPSKNVRQRATFSRENTWLLMASRYLNPEINRMDHQRPTVTCEIQRTPRGGALATVTAADDNELHTIVFLDLSGDDRKMITGRRLRGKSQTVQQDLPAPLLKTGKGEVQVIVVDTGGNHTKLSKSIP